jgi:general L-amino acid transport system substrate-binding protein
MPKAEFDMAFRPLLLVAAFLASFPCATRAAPGPEARISTLEQVEKRGFLNCGVSAGLTGFAVQNDAGEWNGFDIDFCRAIAAAIFDDPEKVHFISLGARDRITALQSGQVDLLARAAGWTQSRETGQRLLYAAVRFFDGQGFMARRKQSYAALKDMSGAQICVQQATSNELDLAEFFRQRNVIFQPRPFPSFEEAAKAYEDGQCQALSADVSVLYARRPKLADPDEHIVLGDLITKAPLGPVVRQGDDQWFNIIRWAHFAMVDAEELEVSSENADQALKSENPDIRRLLGVDGDHGEGLGLAPDWTYRIIKHVGNYAETFDRNLGQGSPLEMERRRNALWSKGGILYAPPIR